MQSLLIKNQEWIYTDSAASTPIFRKSFEKMREFMEEYGSIHRGYSYMSERSTERYEEARGYISSVLDPLQRGGFVFTSNTTDSINRLSLMFDLKEETILTMDIEHSSNYLPWKKRAKNVVFLEADENFKIDLNRLEDILRKKRVYAFSFAIASNVSGVAYTMRELKEIYDLCRRYGTYVFHDAAQYVGHYAYEFRYADAMAFAGHKMYCPAGIGGLLVSNELIESDYNAITGGGNVIHIDFLTGDVLYKKGPHKHEIGTPNGMGAVALAEAFRVLKETVGYNKLQKHTESLSSFINENLLEFDLIGNEKQVPIFIIENSENNRQKLYKSKIAFRNGEFCVYNLIENRLNRKSVIRLSGGLAVTLDDMERIRKTLAF